MAAFYIIIGLLTFSLLITLLENRKQKLNKLIYDKQNELGDPIVEVSYKSNGKYGIAISVLLLLVTVPFIQNDIKCDNDIYCFSKDLFQVTEVSAGEYLVNLYGEGFSFGMNVFVLNTDIVTYNEELSYFNGFNKYHVLNDLIEFESFEVEGIIYTKVTIDGRYTEYISVEHDELTLSVRRFEFDFKEFEKDIEVLNDMLDEYPPVVSRQYHDSGGFIDTLKPNDNYSQIKDDYYRNLYEIYFESQGSRGRDSEPSEMRRIEYNFIIDGQFDDLGEVRFEGTSFYGIDVVASNEQIEQMKYDEVFTNNPVWISSESDGGAMWITDGLDGNLFTKGFINTTRTDNDMKAYASIIADLSNMTIDEQMSLDIRGNVNGIEVGDFYVIDSLLIIPPFEVQTVYKVDSNLDFDISFEIEVYLNDKVMKYNHSYGFNAYWH